VNTSNGQLSVDLGLGDEEVLVPGVDIIDDWLPAVRVVKALAESGSIDDGEAQIEKSSYELTYVLGTNAVDSIKLDTR
jgi:hypothetical protein